MPDFDVGGSATVVVSGPITVNQGAPNAGGAAAWPVAVSNFPATQPVSGTVAATQSGAWTTGRTWILASGTDSVAAVQSGAWVVAVAAGSITVSGTVAISGTVAVTQSTSPWVVSLTSTTITGTVAVTQSGAWTVTAEPSLTATPKTGQTTSNTSAVQLSSSSSPATNLIIVQALSGNKASVFVGGSGITTSTGVELVPSQPFPFFVANITDLYVIGANNTDGVCWSVG